MASVHCVGVAQLDKSYGCVSERRVEIEIEKTFSESILQMVHASCSVRSRGAGGGVPRELRPRAGGPGGGAAAAGRGGGAPLARAAGLQESAASPDPKTRIFRWIFTKNTASTDSHSRRSLRSLLECSCFAFLVARYRSLLEMRLCSGLLLFGSRKQAHVAELQLNLEGMFKVPAVQAGFLCSSAHCAR